MAEFCNSCAKKLGMSKEIPTRLCENCGKSSGKQVSIGAVLFVGLIIWQFISLLLR